MCTHFSFRQRTLENSLKVSDTGNETDKWFQNNVNNYSSRVRLMSIQYFKVILKATLYTYKVFPTLIQRLSPCIKVFDVPQIFQKHKSNF